MNIFQRVFVHSEYQAFNLYCFKLLWRCYYCSLWYIQPKYIGNLLKAAEQRKQNMERRIEKSVQKEREAEKGLFDDKEAFVTDAYRRKMEQIRQEEERECRQEELEGISDYFLVCYHDSLCSIVVLVVDRTECLSSAES